jgi:hypothetical protein
MHALGPLPLDLAVWIPFGYYMVDRPSLLFRGAGYKKGAGG